MRSRLPDSRDLSLEANKERGGRGGERGRMGKGFTAHD
jgi:hypothetical protein